MLSVFKNAGVTWMNVACCTHVHCDGSVIPYSRCVSGRAPLTAKPNNVYFYVYT